MKLVPTPELLRAVIALEDNPDFQVIVRTMHDRAEWLAVWSCMPGGMTPEMRTWAQGRVQELSDWVNMWVTRRNPAHEE